MPDEPKKDEEKKPKEVTADDLKDTLKGVLGWVQKEKAQAKTAGKGGSPWGWVVGLILAAIIFFALAFLAWRAWKKGREIAKLKHQIDVDKEKKRQAEVDAKLTSLEEKRKRLEEDARSLEVDIKEAKDEVAKLETERREAHATIDAVTTWEDVDAILD